MNIDFTNLKRLFFSEIASEEARFPAEPQGNITESDLQELPEPVARYFRVCGFLNKKKAGKARIIWKTAALRLSAEKNWMPIECLQFNSMPEPARIVYMKHRLGGILPFEARDKCQSGHGSMYIKLFKCFTIGNAAGAEMDASALVTVLAETLFHPSYALQSYISWPEHDARSAKAVLTFNNISVSGIFYFDDKGYMIRFVTDDRYMSATGSKYSKIKWTAMMENYSTHNGLCLPSKVSAQWNTDKGDYTYFTGEIENIEFR